MATVETDARDGATVNDGQSPPDGLLVDKKTNNGTDPKNDQTLAPEAATANQEQNVDAFASNQSVPADKDAEKPESASVNVTQSSEAGEKEKTEKEKAMISAEVPAIETEKQDADAVEQVAEKASTEPAEDKEPMKLEEQPDKSTADSSEPKSDAHAQMPTTAEDPAVTKDDVAMTDAPPQADSAIDTGHEEAVKDSSNVEVKSAAQVEEPDAHSISVAVDPPNTSATAPASADTPMADAPAATKTSRDRDDDEDDAPSAKRAKLDSEEPPTKVEQAGPSGSHAPAVDEPGQSSQPSLYFEDGKPKPLGHPSLDNMEITDYQNRQMRHVLASVKKTKAGMSFRLPVQSLWPTIWGEYANRIAQPMDISTMEKKLRGESTLPEYVNMAAFKRDLDLIVENAITFNGEAHDVTEKAKAARESVLSRMEAVPAVEPAKPEKEQATKQLPKRHAESRMPAAQAESKPTAPKTPPRENEPEPEAEPSSSIQAKQPAESPVFAIPPNSGGVPLIRRDNSKAANSSAKRPLKSPKNKDLPYDVTKKLSPELKFCETVLEEIMKIKYFPINGAFMNPVDPVALNIPNYHKIVKQPMDLSTIKSKLQGGEYANAKGVEKDINLIVKNSRSFNGETHGITSQAKSLLELFKTEFKKKDEYLAKLPTSGPQSGLQASVPSPRLTEEEESDGPEELEAELETEPEPSPPKDTKPTSVKLETLLKRLAEEQAKVNEEINSMKPDVTAVEVSQSVIAALQMAIVKERNALAEELAPKQHKTKSTPKAKKASGAASAAKASKKATKAAGGSGTPRGGAGSSKKATKAAGTKKAPKRKIGPAEIELLENGITQLEGKDLENAIEIISDAGQGENESGELELELNSLSHDTLVKLFDVVTRCFPNLLEELERKKAEAAKAAGGSSRTKTATPKKNKPMSKSEQERKIQQLSELKAAAAGQASGSQEPIDSIEGGGEGGGEGSAAAAASSRAAAKEEDSGDDDDDSSEED